jgi:hypothetical protein
MVDGSLCGALMPPRHTSRRLGRPIPIQWYSCEWISQAIKPNTVPAAETVEMPLSRIFMAAGSLMKELLADQETSAPVCMKKPI